MFVAAVASPSTRSLFISTLADWINSTPSNGPLTDLYETASGECVLFLPSLLSFLLPPPFHVSGRLVLLSYANYNLYTYIKGSPKKGK
jgi:Domain of unknown function (DUF1793)